MTGIQGFDRRTALKLAAAVGGLSASAPFARTALAENAGKSAPALAPGANAERAPSPGWHRVVMGEAVITPVLDGKRPGEGPYPTFGADQSQEKVAELMRANCLPETSFVNTFSPTLIEIGGELVLVDTGMGAGMRDKGVGFLTERMKDAGYRPSDVTIVILTHFHGDHIGGLMEAGKPAFPNARYVAGRKEYEWWTSEEAKSGSRSGNAQMVEENVVPFKDKTTFVAEGDKVIEGITAHEAFGHTPGHMIFEIASGKDTLWMAGDCANHFVASLQRPEWHVSFDQDKEMAVETRKRVFGMLAKERRPFIGYHMPFPAIGYVAAFEPGYRFIPATYQFDVES